MWIAAINREETIKAQGVLDELNRHQTPRGKSKINISLCRRKSFQRTDIEEIRSRFDQFRPVVSNLEVCLPKKLSTPNNIGDALGGPQRQFCKESVFFHMTILKMLALSQLPSQSNTSLKEQKSSVHSLLLVLRKVTVLLHGNLLHANVQM